MRSHTTKVAVGILLRYAKIAPLFALRNHALGTVGTKAGGTTRHLETEFVDQVGNIFATLGSHFGTVDALGNTARHVVSTEKCLQE